MKALVLCAGLGTRLRPLTDSLPKPMLDVGGEPLVAHHLRALASAGVRDVAINLHHHGEAIVAAVGNGDAFGLRVRYATEPELRGSAGAIHGFAGFFDEPFFVVYGDVYHQVDMAELAAFHERTGAVLSLVTTTADDPTRCGVVTSGEDGRVARFVEKPQSAPPDAAVNAGLYACDARLATLVPPGVSDFGRDVIPSLLRRGESVYAFSTSAIVQDIGTPEGYARARTLATGRR